MEHMGTVWSSSAERFRIGLEQLDMGTVAMGTVWMENLVVVVG